MEEESGKKNGFWRRFLKVLGNILVASLIIVPCLFSLKLKFKLDESQATVDSLQYLLSANRRAIDSLKTIQDNEILMRDSLEDLVDRTLGERASIAMIAIDTTLDEDIARREVAEKLALESWVDSITEPFPEGVAAHVRLRFIRSKAQRMERLEHLISSKFQD